MYDFLSKYLMNEEDLVQNGYPRPCPSAPGKAVFKSRKEQPSKDCKYFTLFVIHLIDTLMFTIYSEACE